MDLREVREKRRGLVDDKLRGLEKAYDIMEASCRRFAQEVEEGLDMASLRAVFEQETQP